MAVQPAEGGPSQNRSLRTKVLLIAGALITATGGLAISLPGAYMATDAVMHFPSEDNELFQLNRDGVRKVISVGTLAVGIPTLLAYWLTEPKKT